MTTNDWMGAPRGGLRRRMPFVGFGYKLLASVDWRVRDRFVASTATAGATAWGTGTDEWTLLLYPLGSTVNTASAIVAGRAPRR